MGGCSMPAVGGVVSPSMTESTVCSATGAVIITLRLPQHRPGLWAHLSLVGGPDCLLLKSHGWLFNACSRWSRKSKHDRVHCLLSHWSCHHHASTAPA